MTYVKDVFGKDLFDFHKFDPFAVGYDKMFDDLQEMAKNVTKAIPSYPPYNIRQVKDNKWVIELAVAGFAKSDIEVTLEGNKLVIKGATQDNEPEEGTFLHKGIATRNFTREFKLADKIEIENAELTNGMLKIWLENLVKTQDMVKKISVKSKE
jgi:molecular chaperone IbpA